MHKAIKPLSIPLLLFCSTTVLAASFPTQPGSKPDLTQSTVSEQEVEPDKFLIAANDHITIVPNKISVVEGSVITNDLNGNFVELISSPVSEYGFLVLNADGSFTYTLYANSSSVTDLKVGDVVTDEFLYTYIAISGQSASAKLSVQIIGNPVDADGNTVFQAPVDEPYDNVDVEFNNRSAQATPLNSGRNIKGHLHHSGDKDWYKLASSGNEIVSLEVCPQGSSCFGKKSWVLYVFDSDKLTQEMEEQRYIFSRWLDDTGSTIDESGTQIITGTNGSSNHMYLNYRTGAFDGALIGIVDPCFDTSNKVDIGVGDGAKNYLIAISSTLKGDAGSESCGNGSVVLHEPGLNVIGQAPDGKDSDGNIQFKPKKYTTTQESSFVFPKSDDQYSIKITGTGLNPLLSEEAKAKSATYAMNIGELMIPKLRIVDQLFSANLSLEKPVTRNANKENNLMFGLSNLRSLSVDEDSDAFQATYNPKNKQVIIPRVTDLNNGNAYSVIMQYHPAGGGKDQWIDVINYELIQ
ncbi:MAG: VCBS domain-containing protein [Methylococcales bacterium]|nr:VCBS domain-containing protein [Methylococcales bacterium]